MLKVPQPLRGEEGLGGIPRFEPLHFPLSSSDGQMGVFSPIIGLHPTERGI